MNTGWSTPATRFHRGTRATSVQVKHLDDHASIGERPYASNASTASRAAELGARTHPSSPTLYGGKIPVLMMKMPILVSLLATCLAACTDDSPGRLAGTWRSVNGIPMTLTFRSGETEAMGIIEKVSYRSDGNSVIVSYKDGLMKGSAVRFVFVDPATVTAVGVTYRKVPK